METGRTNNRFAIFTAIPRPTRGYNGYLLAYFSARGILCTCVFLVYILSCVCVCACVCLCVSVCVCVCDRYKG